MPAQPIRRVSCLPAFLCGLFVLGGLAACSAVPAAAPAVVVPAAAPAGAAAPALAVADAVDTPPAIDLSGEILFRIVYAEVAVQRGELGAAFTEYLNLARRTEDPRFAHRATEIAVAARAMVEALDATRLWFRLAPHTPEAEQTHASLLVANGKFDEALPLLQHQVDASPHPVEVLDRLQRVLAHAPNTARGFALLQTLAARYAVAPDTGFGVELILARAAHAAGDAQQAVAHANAAVRLRPDSEVAVIAAAQMLVGEDGADAGAVPAADPHRRARDEARHQARDLLSTFLAAHPAAGEAREVYARLLVGDGLLDEARTQFEDLLRRAPEKPDPLFALGVLELEAEHFAKARDYLERYRVALGDSPDRDRDLLYVNLARAAEGERRYEDALDLLHRVHGDAQRDAAREREVFILGRLNRVDEALHLIEQMPAATSDERSQRVRMQVQLLRDAHRFEDSFRIVEEALRASPDDTDLLYEAAMTAERLDRIDVMEERLRHLLRLRPDFAHAYNALGYSLADRNLRLPEAYQLIDHALNLSPDDGFIVDSMGWVQFRMGNLSAARDTLTRAFRLKADPDVAAHLGEVLWAMGDHDRARELLLDAKRRDGESETLRATLQRLKIEP